MQISNHWTASRPNGGVNMIKQGLLSSKLLSLFRNDDFEGAVGTAMDIGATVLKVGFTKVGTGFRKILQENAFFILQAMGAA